MKVPQNMKVKLTLKMLIVVGDSIMKYVPQKNLSAKQNLVKLITHPDSTKDNMLHYVKPIMKRIPDLTLFRTETDLTNSVNTMKKWKN